MKALPLLIFLSSLNLQAAVPKAVTLKAPTDRSYEQLIKKAFSDKEDMQTRWKALMSAAEIGRERAIPDLLKASQSKAWFMKNAALTALVEYDPAQSSMVAKKLLKDKALVVRSAAASVLVKMPESSVREILWKELDQKYNFKNKKSLWIRPQILAGLVAQPRDVEMPQLYKLLNEKELPMQLLAVQGLEKLSGAKLGDKNTSPQKLVQLWKQNKIN